MARKNKKLRRRKKKNSVLVFVLLSVLGTASMLYPSVSDYVNNLSQTKVIASYHTEVNDSARELIEETFEKARLFNEKVKNRGNKKTDIEALREEYYSTLRLGVSPIMAYIEIPKIDVYLPIYHGTADVVLQAGIGHLEGTSLPIGGENTHAALSGHRGLPSAKMFTNLNKLEIGDMFVIHVLNQSLIYEVENIDVVLPAKVESLSAVRGRDLVTLITCTPYAVNTHRLLVRGSRVEGEALTDISVDRFIWQKQPLWFPWQFILFLASTALIVIMRIALTNTHGRRRRKHRAQRPTIRRRAQRLRPRRPSREGQTLRE